MKTINDIQMTHVNVLNIKTTQNSQNGKMNLHFLQRPTKCSNLTPSVRGDPLRVPRNKFHRPQTCG